MMRTFMGFLMPADGYGYATIKIAELLRTGYAGWQVIDMRSPDGTFNTDDGREWWLAGRVVALCTPEWLERIDAEDGLISYTMCESTRLYEDWVRTINQYAQALIVPCAWNAEVFRENGVTRPIHVVPLGVDGKEYPLRPSPQFARKPYTFVWSGTPDRRKGYDLAYRCFWEAFGHNPDVRLVMHFRKRPPGLNGARDPNVKIIAGLLDQPALHSMLTRADAFVFPARGEGWGMPPREAAAVGLPVIATQWGGLAEGIEQWALPLRVAKMSPAEDGWLGEWAEPDSEHLVALLRWCYEHQQEAAVLGQRAAGWLRENGSWEQTAEGVNRVMG